MPFIRGRVALVTWLLPILPLDARAGHVYQTCVLAQFAEAWMRFCAVFMTVVALVSTPAAAQSTTGTIAGRVMDLQNLPLPGVTVTATSPSRQGALTTVTSDSGDYLLALLPSGTYIVRFELNGFQSRQQTLTLAPTETRPLNI